MPTFWSSFIKSWIGQNCISCGHHTEFGDFCSICTKGIEWDTGRIKSGGNSVFLYTDIIRAVIISAKFQPNEVKARSLIRHAFHSRQIDQLINDFSAETAEAICFVPIHWRRRISRGFDLSALIANALSYRLKIPVRYAICCVRQEDPSTLSTSKENRQARVKNRFRLNRSHPIEAKIILVDDVVTTGTTLDAVSQLLVDQGCQVLTFTLARNP